MRIILKPAGVVVLLVGIISLVVVSVIASLRGTGAATMPPAITRIQLDNLKEAEVEDLLDGDFVRKAEAYSNRATGPSGGKSVGVLSPFLSFNCWDETSVAEAKIVANPEGAGNLLEIRNLSGRPAAQLYTWKKLPVAANTKYIISCEYQAEAEGIINLDSTGLAGRKMQLPATNGTWKTVRTSVDRERAGDLGICLQYFGEGNDKPIRLRSLRLWRVK